MARILIAEGDSVAAEAAAVICKAARHTVTVVGSGVEAVLLLDAVPFDLLIVGARLPRMDGLALASAIRDSAEPYAGMPIVGVAAASDREMLAQLGDAGADAVVARPYRHNSLAQAVTRLLARGPAPVSLFRRHSGELDRGLRDA